MDPKPAAAKSLAEILKGVDRQVTRARKRAGKRDKAAAAFRAAFPQMAERVSIASLKTGVLMLETASPPLLQEIESFHRHAIQEKLRAAGLEIAEVRARLRS
jgi:hypothetical protein